MITRRGFLKRVGVALAALGTGIRPNPLEEEQVISWPVDNPSFVVSDAGVPKPELTQGGIVPGGKPPVLTCNGSIIEPDWPYGRSPLVLDNFGIQDNVRIYSSDVDGNLKYEDGDLVTVEMDGKTYTKTISMQKLDSAGVDTVDLRKAIADIESSRGNQ